MRVAPTGNHFRVTKRPDSIERDAW